MTNTFHPIQYKVHFLPFVFLDLSAPSGTIGTTPQAPSSIGILASCAWLPEQPLLLASLEVTNDLLSVSFHSPHPCPDLLILDCLRARSLVLSSISVCPALEISSGLKILNVTYAEKILNLFSETRPLSQTAYYFWTFLPKCPTHVQKRTHYFPFKLSLPSDFLSQLMATPSFWF